MQERPDRELSLNDLEINYILAGWSKGLRAENEAALQLAISRVEKKLRDEFKKERQYTLDLAAKHADAEVWARMPQLASRQFTPKGHKHPDDLRGGGTDCMFDILVSECATDAGIADGTEFTSITGCPFLVFSDVDAAVTYANASRQTTDQDTVFYVCSGVYTIASSQSIDPPTSGSYHFYGAGQGGTTQIIAGANSISMFSIADLSQVSMVTFDGFYFDDNQKTSIKIIDFPAAGTATRAQISRCWFDLGGDAANVGIEPGSGTQGCRISQCTFTGVGIGIGGASLADAYILGNTFESGLAVGIKGGAAAGGAAGNFLIQANSFKCTIGIQFDGGLSISGSKITDNLFVVVEKGIDFAAGVTVLSSIGISDNVFRDIGNGKIGIDFASLGSFSTWGIGITDNHFYGNHANAIGIRGDTTGLNSSMATDNTFVGFTSGNEITAWTGTGNKAFHNQSSSSVGVDQPMADIGSPYGHSSTATAAPSDADYLVGTANSGLSAEIVVGTTPGGELGGTWASPTVDATHSGSAHHNQAHGPAQHTEGTAWRIVYQDANGDEQEIGLGTSGQVLTSAGASSAPAFATPAGGGNDDLSWIAMVM